MRKLLLTLLATTAIAQPALAADTSSNEGKWMLRARALDVIPDEGASITGAVTGSNIEISDQIVPELDVTYFATNNIAFELIAAITPHDVNTSTSSAGALDLGDVWLLPPTLTAQYHFTDLGKCKPYVGAGVNYTHFFGADKGTSVTDVSYGDSFGPALQAGVDYMLDDHWLINLDIKKIWINSDVKFNGGAIAADVDIDPLVVGIGFGYKF
ncbi:MAG: OmpW family protein [Alphaproteobacteria bacterium]|nr:OmpW family protein [Alphaproteobacteria bacterium]